MEERFTGGIEILLWKKASLKWGKIPLWKIDSTRVVDFFRGRRFPLRTKVLYAEAKFFCWKAPLVEDRCPGERTIPHWKRDSIVGERFSCGREILLSVEDPSE